MNFIAAFNMTKG